MLKSLKEIEKMKSMDANGVEIVVPDIHTRYSEKDHEYENMCFADFAAYPHHSSKEIKEHEGEPRIRIIRFINYKLQSDEVNCYCERCLLFFPWRNEVTEIKQANTKELFE